MAGVVLEQSSRDGGSQQRPAFGNGSDGRDELVLGRVLEQKPTGSGAKRVEDVLVGVERGDDDDSGWLGRLEHPGGGFDAVQTGHPYVHEYDVRVKAAGCGDRLMAVGRFLDLDARLGAENHAEAGADQALVVCK